MIKNSKEFGTHAYVSMIFEVQELESVAKLGQVLVVVVVVGRRASS